MIEHKEIINALKKIPPLLKEYAQLEKSITGADTIKKKLSKEDYQYAILNFDHKNHKGIKLKNRIFTIAKQLESSRPDFSLSISNYEQIKKYLDVVKEPSDRIKKQLLLYELLQIKKQFKTYNDFLDDKKVKELNKYLKGIKLIIEQQRYMLIEA